MVIGALEPAFPPQPPVQKPKMHVQAAEGAACEAGIPQSLLVDEVPLQGITLRGPSPTPVEFVYLPTVTTNMQRRKKAEERVQQLQSKGTVASCKCRKWVI